MGLLAQQPKKPGLLANVPIDYKGTLGELPIATPFGMKTSTPAFVLPKEPLTSQPLTSQPFTPPKIPIPTAEQLKNRQETISAAPETPVSKLIRTLPEPLRGSLDFVINNIRDGLFGNPKDRAVVREYERAGKPSDLPTLLKTEGFLPFLGRTQTDQIEHRITKHENAGTDTARAAELAFYEVFSKGMFQPGTEAANLRKQAEQRLADLQPTAQEKKTALFADIGQKLGSAADILNIIPIGSLKISQEAAEIIAHSKDIKTIANVFKREVPSISDEALTIFSKLLVDVDNVDDVQRVINRTQFSLKEASKTAQETAKNTTKVSTIFHGTSTGNFAIDELGNINFGTIKNEIAQFAGNTGKVIDVPLKNLVVRDLATKDELFNAVSKLKQQYLDQGVDVLRSGNHAIGINPVKIADVTGIKVADNFLNKPISELMTKNLPDSIKPIVEKANSLAKEDFVKQFNEGLTNQNLTKRETAINIQNEIKKSGFNSIEDFYDGVTSHTPPSSTSAVALDAAVARPIANTSPELLPSGVQQSIQSISQPSLDEVNHIEDVLSKPFAQVVNSGVKTTKEPNLFKHVTTKLAKAFRSTIEYVQDSEVRVRKLLEDPKYKVTEATDPYMRATRYPGSVAAKIEVVKTRFESLVNDMVEIADKGKRDVSLVRQDVNEYLQAIHAPERNKVFGDRAAGMTDEVAQATIKRIEASPEAAAIKQIAESARKLNEQGLILLRDAQVISDDLYKTLTTKYKYHVPLQRVFENESDFVGALTGRGFDVRSSGIKGAKGSERQVADILSNIMHNYNQAILRSEKNMVDLATLGFVRDNRETLKGLMDVYKPRAIGKGFDGARLLMEKTSDPSYLQMFENGKPVWIKISDPALALAFRGVNMEKIGTLLRAIKATTQFYAGLATRFNLAFGFPNKIRDLQETMVYLAAQKDVGFKGAMKTAVKDPRSIKDVADTMRGLDTPGTRLYQEMKEMGGTTGGFGLSTRNQTELDLNKMFAVAQSRPRQMAQDVLGIIDGWNTIFEDSTRLSVYRQALAQGMSKERAAFLAKEASINFNRMGRGGPVINALWMFSNASIQGSAKMLRAFKNPKVLIATVATVGAAVGAVNEWNDKIDPQWRDKVTKWDRLNSLPVIVPGKDGKGVTYISIPVSWGLKPIKVMADFAYDAASGQEIDSKRFASDFFTSIANAYNPLGGTDPASALTPSILEQPYPFIDIARNKSWSGSKIRPDFDKNAPADVQYFSNLGETASGKVFIEGTKALQESTGIALSPADMKYAFEQMIGGAGKFTQSVGNAAFGFATGEPVPADEFPFVSRFLRQRTEEEIEQGAGGETSKVQALLQGQSRERFYVSQAAEDKYKELATLPKAEAARQWEELSKSSPDMATKVADIAAKEKKGLTYTERLLTQLGVLNGERAKYLFDKFNELKTREEKAALWQAYTDKGIITAQVADQLTYLINHSKHDIIPFNL